MNRTTRRRIPTAGKEMRGSKMEGFVKIQTLLLILSLVLLSYSAVLADRKDSAKSQADKLFARAKPEDYMGSTGCAECHADKAANFNESAHAMFMAKTDLPDSKRGCEGCHGPGKLHTAEENGEVIAFRKMTPKESSLACLRCHEKTMTASHWHRTDHARADVSCVSCHQIHPDSDPDIKGLVRGKDPRTAGYTARVDKDAMLRADEATLCGSCHAKAVTDFRNVNHHPVPEGSMLCSDCHEPHPTKDTKIRKATLKDNCVTCHTEFAGPFLYEHDPVSGISSDGCKECHRPHGSNNSAMLNSTNRGLCAQCHTDKLGSHYPNQTCWASGCHVALHGSNTNSRFLSH